MRIITIAFISICFAACTGASKKIARAVQQELKHYPAEQAGQQRFVIYLPQKTAAEEKELSVELIAGKMMQIDCNQHGLQGEILEQTIPGMGYDYFALRTDGTVFSTKMGCPDNSLRTEFVSAQSKTVSYNARLPLVIYTPAGYELHYRIWNAGVIQKAERR